MEYLIKHRPSFALLEIKLNQNEKITAEAGALIYMESGIEEGRIQVAIALQAEAEQTKKNLMITGFPEDTLDLKNTIISLDVIHKKMTDLSSLIGKPLSETRKMPKDPDELADNLKYYLQSIDEIDRFRQNIHSEKSEQRTKLSSLISSLKRLQGLQQYKDKDVASLSISLDKIKKEWRS